jgi:predicted DNA-binding protein
MHQTTIRFGHELWDTLEHAAEDGGVSVAQYVREAAIERLARSGALGDVDETSKHRVTEPS